MPLARATIVFSGKHHRLDASIKRLSDAASAFGSGLYSVMRTVGHTRILSPSMHAERLNMDAPRLKAILRTLYEHVRWTEEQRVTVALFDNHVIVAMNEPLPKQTSNKTISIQTCLGEARTEPAKKTTNWITERQRLASEQYEETVLVDAKTGEFREGLSSNFFAVFGGELFAADPTKVLRGTVSEMVLQCAESNNIHVRYGRRWTDPMDAAFITSTSRLVLPVDRMALPNQQTLVLNSSENAVAKALQTCVMDRMFDASEPF